jgi:uncharacterized protein (TIGR00159 family)
MTPFLRVTDVVDILLATALLYTAVVWIRRTQAALVAAGLVILAVLYFAVRALGLQLMTWVFQGFFAIFVIVIVVIFQEELRQLFERLAVWGLRRGRRAAAPADVTDVLVQCCADFARDRIGALIVLPAAQPIGRHVRGGIELDGKLTVPLLKSLFDPHSPGHDGAVIVENGRVSRFAAHLPLSSDFRQLAGVGTRHSAALGLAELTDAVCIVVSEERGRISVAREGRLVALREVHELGEVLRRAQPAPAATRDGWKVWQHLGRQHWAEKLACLAVVVGLWYLSVPGARPAQASFEVPVNVVNLPADYVLEEVKPAAVEVKLVAPARAFYLFDRSRLGVTVDASPVKNGRRTFQIGEENLRYPSDVTLQGVHPSQVTIAVQPSPDGDRSAQAGEGP